MKPHILIADSDPNHTRKLSDVISRLNKVGCVTVGGPEEYAFDSTHLIASELAGTSTGEPASCYVTTPRETSPELDSANAKIAAARAKRAQEYRNNKEPKR